MVSTKPVIKSSACISVLPSLPVPVKKEDKRKKLVGPDQGGYFKGKAPSRYANDLEREVKAALIQMGAIRPSFLDWDIEDFLHFVKEEVGYYNSPPKGSKWNTLGEMLLDNTFLGMGKSHPHIQSWNQLSVEEAIDFLGVDIALIYQGRLIALDITANPKAIILKKEKMAYAFKEARLDMLHALGFYHYVVVLGSYGELDVGKLKEGLDNLDEERFITSIEII